MTSYSRTRGNTQGEVTFNNRPFDTVVRETRGGRTREFTRRRKGSCARGPGTMLPLFVGYPGR